MWPLAARAQQAGKLPTVGFLGQSTPLGESERAAAFAQRLKRREAPLSSGATPRTLCCRSGRSKPIIRHLVAATVR
jgi:hypothetical protein